MGLFDIRLSPGAADQERMIESTDSRDGLVDTCIHYRRDGSAPPHLSIATTAHQLVRTKFAVPDPKPLSEQILPDWWYAGVLPMNTVLAPPVGFLLTLYVAVARRAEFLGMQRVSVAGESSDAELWRTMEDRAREPFLLIRAPLPMGWLSVRIFPLDQSRATEILGEILVVD